MTIQPAQYHGARVSGFARTFRLAACRAAAALSPASMRV